MPDEVPPRSGARNEIRGQIHAGLAAKRERLAAQEERVFEREVQRRIRQVRVPTVAAAAALPDHTLRNKKAQAQVEANRLKNDAMMRWAAAEAIEAQLDALEPPAPAPPSVPEE